VRARFNEALQEAHAAYCAAEEVAACLALEVHRLSMMETVDAMEAQERDERAAEKRDLLGKIKENMRYILDRVQELSRERERCIMDVYAGVGIGDLENRLSELSPKIQDLASDMRDRSRDARVSAKVSLEVAQTARKT
jgi:hypothetical protein